MVKQPFETETSNLPSHSVSGALRLRESLKGETTILAPGVVDAYWARLCEVVGFSAMFMTGSGVSNTLGFPDLGITTATEMTDRVRYLCRASSVPLIADADTGFGNQLNVRRTVRDYFSAGAAALVLEDQDPAHKRAGYLTGKAVISAEEMVDKIRMAVDAREDHPGLIIGRTDAIGVEPFEAVIERCKAYVEAGADMINVDSPQSMEQLKVVASEVQPPLGHLTHQVAGTSVILSQVSTLVDFGYSIIGFPDLIMRVATKSAWNALDRLAAGSSLGDLADEMISMQDRWNLITGSDAAVLELLADENDGRGG